jgi:hypothetical protein
MRRIFFYGSAEDIRELEVAMAEEGLPMKKTTQLNLDQVEIVHYLTVGGGALGLGKCLLSFLKLKYQTRKVTIKTSNGQEVNIEALSVDEINELLKSANEILLADQKEKNIN